MPRALLLDANNVVLNSIVADEGYEHPDFKVVFSDTGNVGDTYIPRWKRFNPPIVEILPATPDQIDVERDRRIAAGFMFEGELFQSRSAPALDQDNIRDAYAKANRVIREGGGAIGDVFWYGDGKPFGWIAADNDVMALDAPAMVAFAETLGQRKKDLIFAASEIKARIRAGEIIADVTADSLWPT